MADEVEVIKKETKEAREPTQTVKTDEPSVADLEPISHFLGVDDAIDNMEQLRVVWDYLDDRKTVSDKLWALRNIENRLVPPKLGETRLSKIYGFLKSQKMADEIDKQRDAFLR